MNKYEITDEVHPEYSFLKRIRSLKDFGNVKKGDLGGFISGEKNLSHYDNAWVFDDARVSGDAWVGGDAIVSDDAWVYGNVIVSDNAWVYNNARVSGDAWVYDDTVISGDAFIFGDERVYIIKSCNNGVIYNGYKSRYLTLIYKMNNKV